jgi:excisionase family DNA binding protein
MTPTFDHGDTISVPEASRLSALGESTIRRLIESKEIDALRDSKKRIWVSKESLMKHLATSRQAPRSINGASKLSVQPPQAINGAAIVATLEEQIRILKEALSYEKELSKEFRTQIRVLESERTQHLAEMRALLSGKNEGLLSIKRWIGK